MRSGYSVILAHKVKNINKILITVTGHAFIEE